MKRIFLTTLVLIFLLAGYGVSLAENEAGDSVSPVVVPEEEMAAPEGAGVESPQEEIVAPIAVAPVVEIDKLDQADELMEDDGGLENCKLALDICLQEVKKNPGDYRANWMAAKACREFASETKKSEAKGWEETCKIYGKKGMEFAEKAIQLDPKQPEGHYWFGMNVGIYSDGVSILTALKEGLKGKTQTSFEAVYNIDKLYDKGGPIVALGRFYYVLPWIAGQDKDKSMEYYREFQKTEFYRNPDAVEFNVYFAELLMEKKGTKEEAKALLLDVPKISKDQYWNKKAKALLAEM